MQPQTQALLSAMVSPMAVPNALENLARMKKQSEETQSLSGIDPTLGAFLAVGAAVLVGIIVVRAAAGYYIGKQFGRPKASAAMGAFFGAPGVGVVSLWGQGKGK